MWRSSTCSTGRRACSPCGSRSRDSRLLFAQSCKKPQMGSTSSATLKVFECTQENRIETEKIFWYFLKITRQPHMCLWLHCCSLTACGAVFWLISLVQMHLSRVAKSSESFSHLETQIILKRFVVVFFFLICLCLGGLICRGILSTLADHNVQTFISLSSPQAGQYGGRYNIFFLLLSNSSWRQLHTILVQTCC